MKSFLKALKSYWLLIVVVVIIVAVSGSYFAGYRFDAAGITRVGTVSMSGLPEGTNVYIDASRKVRVTGGKVSLPLSPGTHNVIVESKDNEPWNEIFTVAPAADTALSPILVPVTPGKALVIGADIQKALTLMRSPLPTKAKPLVLDSGCALVYVSGSRIIAEGTTTPSCTPPPYLACADISSENPTGACAPTIIFSPAGPIHAVLPFPGRSDALVVAAGNIGSTVELDPREPQFYAPFFRGAITGGASWTDHSIVLTNGTEVLEISL